MVFSLAKNKIILAAIIFVLIIIAIKFVCYIKLRRKKITEPSNNVQIKVIQNKSFKTLSQRFDQMHSIVRSNIFMARRIIDNHIKKYVEGSIHKLTPKTLEKIVRKKYVGTWDRKIKYDNQILFMKKIKGILGNTCHTFYIVEIENDIDNVGKDHSFSMAFCKDAKITKPTVLVPFTAYETLSSNYILLNTVICDDKMNVIGICTVANRSYLEFYSDIDCRCG